ncbi:hypothetical protein L1D40_13425 [Shewanella insulae]|uniref:Uncharacterized protein n=1 Tax=Shewanella insulae TaxID=2681496 RepID=A0A6L7I1F0_9GAMM|nr:hypothetical protein [Shewanella insulae]MCG9756211.1 hypothetical protein [Shewanella insulae]MXR70419.1 hypothetical protein [Shewanella insulae]
MSNIIQLLERMGQDAALQTEDSILQTIDESQISSEQKELLKSRKGDELAESLKTSKDIICFLIPAKDEDDESENSEESDEKSAVNQ